MKGFLLYGPAPGETAQGRERLVAGLAGEEMNLTRLDGAGVRRDPGSLSNAMRAMGFFGGRQIVLLESAGDGCAAAIRAALDGLDPAHAVLVATAGQLKPSSSLRKLFEAGRATAAIPIYAEPPDRGEIDAMLKAAGAPEAEGAAMQDLLALANGLDPGEFRGVVAKLGLYKLGDRGPVTGDDVTACAPLTLEGEVDAVIAAVAGGDVQGLPEAMLRLAGQGVNPTTLSIGVSRHFRQLHALTCAPEGPDRAIERARPPIFGPRRAAMLTQVRKMGRAGLERALAALTETELALRSSSPAPFFAVLERTLMRIAMETRRRGQRDSS